MLSMRQQRVVGSEVRLSAKAWSDWADARAGGLSLFLFQRELETNILWAMSPV